MTQLQCKEDELRTAHDDMAMRVEAAVLDAEAQSRQARRFRIPPPSSTHGPPPSVGPLISRRAPADPSPSPAAA